MSIELVMPSSHLILCHPLLLLPPVLPSIRVFSNESTLRMRWPKYWSSSFSISPSNEHPGLVSFRMDFIDYMSSGQCKLKPTVRYHHTLEECGGRMAQIQNTDHPECSWGRQAAGTLIHCWWDCKTIQLTLEGSSAVIFFVVVTKLNILLSHDPAISLLGIYPKEVKTYVCTKPCTIMLIAAFFFPIMA